MSDSILIASKPLSVPGPMLGRSEVISFVEKIPKP